MKLAAHASLTFWNALPAPQRARTLALDRFASFPLENRNGEYIADHGDTGYRRETCGAVAGGAVLRDGTLAWLQFLREGLRLPDDQLLFGQLQSRLMVNMAGGVLENGGLCLDRRTGLPYIPGSAVKGCARRMAIQCLLEMRQENKPAQALTALLKAVALTFGWSDLDWRGGRNHRRQFVSDFEFALGGQWEAVREQASVQLLNGLGGFRCGRPDAPWLDLPNYAGAVEFLPAHLVKVQLPSPFLAPPELGRIEPDVVTCHHREYYDRNPGYAGAPDTEEPVPVVFPAIAAGHVFVFAIRAHPSQQVGLVPQARSWLADGLRCFGVGAKTAAGYGWFDTSEEAKTAVWRALEAAAQAERRRREEDAELGRQQKAKEEKGRKAAELKAAMATLTSEQQADLLVAQLTDEQFRGRLDQFQKREPSEQQAVVRALRLSADAPHSRRKFWDDLKAKAQKGGKPAQVAETIRSMSRQMNLGKMP